jgi:hypothetical protein
MSLIGWVRGLFRSDPEKLAAAQSSREERRRARLDVESAKTEAERIGRRDPTEVEGMAVGTANKHINLMRRSSSIHWDGLAHRLCAGR